MNNLGKRIIVIGSPGSGKSTFSRVLAEKTGIPLIHLDKEFWNSGWVETSREQWIKKQEALLNADSWIIDGNYGGTLDMRLEKADTIICFKLSRIVCLYSYFKRVITNINKVRPDMPEGCPEKLDFEFMKYIWDFPKNSGQRNLDRLNNIKDKRTIVFKKRSEANKYLKDVKCTMDWINLIKSYNPCNEQEKKDKEIILYCIDTFDDVLTRKNEVAHITSSAFVVNKNRDKVLMVHHNIYNSWSWTGGHADGEEDLLAVAIREVKEETGVSRVEPLLSDIFSLEILTVVGHKKLGKYVAPHLHLSIAYLVEVDEDEKLKIKKDENSGVRWIPIDEVNEYSNEPHMQMVYSKLIGKVKELNFNQLKYIKEV